MLRLFGEKLRHLRLRQGLSQSELARLLGSTRGHINNLEVGRKMPSLQFLIALANYYGVSTDALLNDDLETGDLPNPATPEAPAASKSIEYFGSRLKSLRTSRDLTQVELAARLGLRTQAHISLLESGAKTPSIELLLQVMAAFQMSADQLLSSVE